MSAFSEYVFAECEFMGICLCVCVCGVCVCKVCGYEYMSLSLLNVCWYVPFCVYVGRVYVYVCVCSCAHRVGVCVYVSDDHYRKSLSLPFEATAEFLSVCFTAVLLDPKTLICTQ